MISVVIPVLNEISSIANLLRHLGETQSDMGYVSEIIVVDGGSTDGTQQAVEDFVSTTTNNIVLVSSEKGRAKQLNIGAQNALSEILYFLHADSFPPKNYDKLIVDEVQKRNLAGCFKMKFDNNYWWLRLASWFTHFRWRACRGGDQSQFITKELFDEIGGYDEDFIIYEDNILINELFKRKQFVVIQEWLITSARLYERIGIWKLQYHFWAIYVKRWFGASAEDIYNYYKKHIA